jgi:hypothetical protein
MRTRTLSLLLACSLAVPIAAASYGDMLGKKVIDALVDKNDRGNWRAVAYPTDNFGVGTAYDDKTDAGFLCATVRCLGLKTPEAVSDWVSTGTGGTVALTAEDKKQLTIAAVLPKLFQIIGFSAKSDSNSVVVTKADIGAITKRYLDRGKAEAYLKSLPESEPIKRAFLEKRLRIVAADMVASSFVASINVDQSRAKELDAKLAQNVGKVLGADSDFSVKISGGKKGQFQVSTQHPVVVAVLIRKQPKAGVLESAPADWSKWPADLETKARTDVPR